MLGLGLIEIIVILAAGLLCIGVPVAVVAVILTISANKKRE